MSEYTTPLTPQLNVVIEIIYAVIKEEELDMILDEKSNDTAQKMLWEDALHTRELLHNIMYTTFSTNSPFVIFYRENPKIIGSFSDFGHVAYVTKRERLRDRQRKRRTRQSWLDILTAIQEKLTSCITQRSRGLSQVGTLSGKNGKIHIRRKP